MNFHFTVDEYNKMHQKYLNDEISNDLWSLYCMMYLQKLMAHHSDVLERLKN